MKTAVPLIFVSIFCSGFFSGNFLFRNMSYSKYMSVELFVAPLSKIHHYFRDDNSEIENISFTNKELTDFERNGDIPYLVVKIKNLGNALPWGTLNLKFSSPSKRRFPDVRVHGGVPIGGEPRFFVVPVPFDAISNKDETGNSLPKIDFSWKVLYSK